MKPPRACRTIEGEEGRGGWGRRWRARRRQGTKKIVEPIQEECLAILEGWSSRYIARRYPTDHLLLLLLKLLPPRFIYFSIDEFIPINRASSPPPLFTFSSSSTSLSRSALFFFFLFASPPPSLPPSSYFLRGNRPSSCSFSSSSPSPLLLLLLFSTVSLPLSRAAERHTHRRRSRSDVYVACFVRRNNLIGMKYAMSSR